MDPSDGMVIGVAIILIGTGDILLIGATTLIGVLVAIGEVIILIGDMEVIIEMAFMELLTEEVELMVI